MPAPLSNIALTNAYKGVTEYDSKQQKYFQEGLFIDGR
jgi:hypothetical protein